MAFFNFERNAEPVCSAQNNMNDQELLRFQDVIRKSSLSLLACTFEDFHNVSEKLAIGQILIALGFSEDRKYRITELWIRTEENTLLKVDENINKMDD